ncbi:hypothetical protein Tsubulata_022647, partial [Turnera subulata]
HPLHNYQLQQNQLKQQRSSQKISHFLTLPSSKYNKTGNQKLLRM